MKPRVVADANIPFLEELLGDSVELIKLPAPAIDREAVKEADALLTRTRTRCDAGLLDGVRCKFVGTATIGTDHIDFDYCNSHGIKVVSAPGCNAPAVAQYVWNSVLRLLDGRSPESVTVGIIGVGHVGRIVEDWGRGLGYRILCCDPPRAEREGDEAFVSLDVIARECDVITFHTPHTVSGRWATHHMAGESFFNKLERKPVIINSARGPVVDTEALLAAIHSGKTGHVVMDCWEGEPDINRELLELAEIATPHIAGYSRQGKVRASMMVAEALCGHFGLPFNPAIEMPGQAPLSVAADRLTGSYDPYADTARLKVSPGTFEAQRNGYDLREEPF